MTCPQKRDPIIKLGSKEKKLWAKANSHRNRSLVKLREAEVLQASGQSITEICRHLGIKDQTYYKWRKEYGGMRVDQAKRLKEIEQENTRLRKLVSDLSLDNAILKETVRGNY